MDSKGEVRNCPPASRRSPSWTDRLAAIVGGRAARRAFVVAIVVGTLLNLINQGEAVWAGAPFHWERALLTYLVPFLVSLHGALGGR